jgi:hypothetical protein
VVPVVDEHEQSRVSPDPKDHDLGSSTADDPWPPHFPHADIDALLTRLERATGADPAEARDLLALVAQEAQRLRTTVVRLSAARLSAAEREASTIVADAQASAATLRSAALEALDARLNEAERLTAAAREALGVERRRAGHRPVIPGRPGGQPGGQG